MLKIKRLCSLILAIVMIFSFAAFSVFADDTPYVQLIAVNSSGEAVTAVGKNSDFTLKLKIVGEITVAAGAFSFSFDNTKIKLKGTTDDFGDTTYAKSSLSPTENYTENASTSIDVYKATFARNGEFKWNASSTLNILTLTATAQDGISTANLGKYITIEGQNNKAGETKYGLSLSTCFEANSGVVGVNWRVCPYDVVTQKSGSDGLIYNTTQASAVSGKLDVAAYTAAGTASSDSVTVSGVYTNAEASTELADANLSGVTFSGSATTATLDVYVKTSDNVVTPVTLTITKDELSSIEVTTPPTKASYTSGETLNLAGMVVTATYASGATKTVTPTSTSPASGAALKMENSTLTVTYTEGGITKTAETTLTMNRATATVGDFTFTAPSSLEYTGESIGTDCITGKDGIGTPALKFAKVTTDGQTKTVSSTLEDRAVAVGEWQVSVTTVEGTEYAAVTEPLTNEAWRFTIASKPLTGATVAVTDVATGEGGFTYTGSAITPAIEVKVNNETVNAENYDATYTNNVNVGEATVSVEFKGNYSGSASTTYQIVAKPITVEIASVTGKAYNGDNDATVTLKFADNAIATGDSEKVSIKSSYVAKWTSADAGTKTVYVTGIALEGDSANNYSVAPTLGSATEGVSAGKDGSNNDIQISKETSGVIGSAVINIYHGTSGEQTLAITDFVFKDAGENTITLAGAAFAANQTSATALSNTTNNAVTLGENHQTYSLNTTSAATDVNRSATWGVKISSTNYEDFNATVTLNIIDKEPATISIGISGDTVYGGAYSVTPSGGHFTYTEQPSYYTITYSGTTADGSAFETGTTAPTKAGTYSVTVKYEDSYGHTTDSVTYPGYIGSATETLTIAPKPITVNWTDTEKTYSGSGLTPTATFVGLESGDATLSPTVTVAKADSGPELVSNAAVNVGTYSATASIPTGAPGANYKFADSDTTHTTEWQIVPVVGTVTVTMSTTSETYIGSQITGAVSKVEFTPTGGGTAVELTASTDYTLTQGENIHVTSGGTVTVAKAVNGNYSFENATGTFTITPINPTITWKLDGEAKTSVVYNGEVHTMTATATGVGADVIDVTYSTESGVTNSATNASSSYTATIASLNNSDYKLDGATNVSQNWTIAKATAPTNGTVKLDKNIYYKNTTEQTITPADFIGWPLNAGTVTFKASSTPSAVSGEALSAISTTGFGNGNFQLAALENADLVGKTASWTVQLDSNNYETTTATVTVTLIDKTPVTFVVNSEENPSTLTAVYTGSPFALTTSLKDYTPPTGTTIAEAWYNSGSTDALTSAPTNVGTYKLVLSYEDDVENNNGVPGYVGEQEITVTITPKEVTVSGITAKDKTYDNTTTAELDYTGLTITGKVGSDDLTATATGAFENVNAGSGKTVTISDITLGGSSKDNYTLAATGQQESTTAAINKATRTLNVSEPKGDAGLTLYGKGTSGSIILAVSADLDFSAAAAITNTASVADIVSLTNTGFTYTASYVGPGRTTLTFTLPATDNYEAGGSVSVPVVVKDGYTVKVSDSVTGGTVKADKATAISGDTVTLTIASNTGYTFSSLTVTNTDANTAVSTNNSSEGTYTFAMPAGNVTVSAEFTQNKYTITEGAVSGVSYTISKKSDVVYGEEITISATLSNSGTAAISGFTYTDSKNKVTTITADSTGTYKFKMPASNITIMATVSTLKTITIDTTIANGTVNVEPQASAARGTTIVVTPTANSTYTIGTVTYKYNAGSSDITSPVSVTSDSEGNAVYSFEMPDADVTVSAEFISTETVEQAAESLTATGGAAAGETEATLEVSVTTGTADALKTAAEAVAVDANTLSAAISANDSVDDTEAAQEADDALAALIQAGLVQVDTAGGTATVKTTGATPAQVTAVRIVNKVYMDVTVKDYDEAASDSFKLEIKPMAQKVATIADSNTDLTDRNSVPMGVAKELSVNAAVELTIGIPDAMYGKATEVGGKKTVYINHNHGGKTYEYPATVSGSAGSYKATFNNPHGFSEFTVTLESSTVASFEAGAGDVRYYPSFKECVADAIAAGKYEITMYKMPTGSDKAEIAKAVTLTFTKSGGASVDFDDLYATWITIGANVAKASTDMQITAGTFVYSTTYTVTVSGTASVQVGSTITLTATVTGADGSTVSSPAIEWSSSDTSVATVVAGTGVVTGVKSGSVNITATYTNLGNDYTSAAYSIDVTSGGGSNNGGSSGEAAPTITKTTSVNGTYTLSSTTAKAGDKVTITANPDSGYEVDAVTVTDKSGNTVSVTKNVDGTYSFTMPATELQPVSTAVTFKSIATPAATGFADVPAESYYADAVAWAVANGITYGTDDTHFSPDGDCTRAQFVTFLWRAAGFPEPVGENPFSDISESGQSAYYKAILWAAEQGITKGTDTEGVLFSPDATINRAQAVTFLNRYAKSSGSGTNTFDDVPAGEYYSEAVDWAVTNGIAVGNSTTENTFGPLDSCIRAQMITFLYRLFVK